MSCPAAGGGPLPSDSCSCPQHRPLVLWGHGEGSVGYATCPSPEMMVTGGRVQGLSVAVIRSPGGGQRPPSSQCGVRFALFRQRAGRGGGEAAVPGQLGRGKAPMGTSQLPADSFCTQVAFPPLSWVHTPTLGFGGGEERRREPRPPLGHLRGEGDGYTRQAPPCSRTDAPAALRAGGPRAPGLWL